jgi:hypothetical protein
MPFPEPNCLRPNGGPFRIVVTTRTDFRAGRWRGRWILGRMAAVMFRQLGTDA